MKEGLDLLKRYRSLAAHIQLDLDLVIRLNLRILDYETNVKSLLCKMG